MQKEFKVAVWPLSLKIVSGVGSLLVCAVAYGAARAIPHYGFAYRFGTAIACVPPALILGSLLFVVRSFRIEGGHLSISRLFWSTKIPLLGVQEAVLDPAALEGSLRIFGNGGLFGITGLYWNKRLGRFRLFATDPKKAVVMRLHDRVVVISPEDPEAFLQELRRLFPRLQLSPVQAVSAENLL